MVGHCGKLRVWLLGLLVLGTNIHAATATTRANPYAKSIVSRNVFSLNAAPTMVVPPRPPPPPITLQGVTSILPRRQALFKVQMPAKPGEAAREISCVLAEGERVGEIEVLEIDWRAGSVRFNNHGTVQTLNLKDHGDHPR